jgi:hypothetical protein
MKNLLLAIFVMAFSECAAISSGASPCAGINSCEISKNTWNLKNWNIEYSKELRVERLCQEDSPGLQVEPDRLAPKSPTFIEITYQKK